MSSTGETVFNIGASAMVTGVIVTLLLLLARCSTESTQQEMARQRALEEQNLECIRSGRAVIRGGNNNDICLPVKTCVEGAKP